MSQKITNRQYPSEFKEEAVALVMDQGYSVSDAAKSLGITTKLLYAWKAKIENERQGNAASIQSFLLDFTLVTFILFKDGRRVISLGLTV